MAQMAKLSGQAYSSGELSRRTGVSTDTLRYYERQGLLQPVERTAAGYRRYPQATLQRVRLIRGALAIGFSIAELRRILQARDAGKAPCMAVRDLAAGKAHELQRRIRELQALRNELQATIRIWDRKLKKTRPHERAGLLEAFVTAHPESTRRISPLVSPGLKQKLQHPR